MTRRSFVLGLSFAVAFAVCGARAAPAPATQTAVFAGGCFWCTEADFEKIPGVVSAVAGYTGGSEPRPTYEQVSSERTGHVEAVKVTFDPNRVSYRALVDKFWRTIDPTDAGGQFCDRGPSYHTAVFVSGPDQRREAEASRAVAATQVKGKFVTPVRDATTFWPAEAYHQDFYKKNPLRYRTYREGCGRDARLKAVWGGR
ncbi:peptide-methionine (S)-S-oxide reductase MsrA [Caulobacter sp. 17J65-9]|uniref:peptide-methionine (S)-S-oxide reductase MsrA n=1 Tax=Caulobacter sp. 17J65-9 TaxID=2709382 RepID=UPI0013C5AA2C|nr:peptide-methionine (S)-S-oxide reductase MsrA [Caulobacter sp. 17J65-9]NEX92465.1 peptide-methionine (S)-S-oxide reductase MsrA [Caulobacter sp. 17J65-9]